MALPIKETPTLIGEDAERFIEKMKYSEDNHISEEEYEKAMLIYKEISLQCNPFL